MMPLARILYALFYLLSLLPLRVLYLLSDFIYLIIYYVVGYRVKLTRKNMADSFPEKSEQELRSIERGFYHWFCDYIVETLKMLSISDKEMKRRMKFNGLEQMTEWTEKGRPCALYLGHYCNWEWIVSMPLSLDDKAVCSQIYHPLENKHFESLFLKIRQRWGSMCIAMNDSIRKLIEYRTAKPGLLTGYISDQVPFWNNIHHWVNFLNHDTPVLTGSERLTKKMNNGIFYLYMRRPRRGYYVADVKVITLDPRSMDDYQVTDAYFKLLEENIREAPQYWLWTHNRWKRTREEFNLRYDETTGRVDIISTVEELKKKKGLL